MYFCFNPFSVRPRFYNVPLYFNAHAYMYMYMCKMSYLYMRAHYANTYSDDCRGQSVSAVKILFVHHMHTLICKVFKLNYEQHLFGNTFLPTDIRFTPANALLNFRSRNVMLSRHMQYRRLDMLLACGIRRLCSESGPHHCDPLLHVRLKNKVK